MIAHVSAHRRANAFAQALEDESAQDAVAQQPEEPAAPVALSEQSEQGRLLTLTEGLGELPKPELDPEVKVVQRAQLVAAMEAMFAEGAPGPAVPEQRSAKAKGAHRASPLRKLRPRSRLTKGIAAGGLTVGVAAGAFGGVAAASSSALPGDHLYGLKRGMEDLKLGMADGDSDRGQIYLDQASTRLNEARRLMDRGRTGHLDHESLGEVRRALSGMQYDASEGHKLLSAAYKRDGSLGPIQALSAFAESHRKSWSALSDKLPVQLGDVRDQVSSVFAAIDEEVEPLRSLLPQPPGQGSKGGTDRGSGTATDTPGTEHSAPSGTTGHDRHSSSAKPKPSSSSSGKDDGLLGETTGGLLDPPKDESTPTPSEGKTGDSTTGPAKPDVTLPPLLPGLLPGLGIDSEDAG
ncbi:MULTISPECIES: DUF5667 domain-containing protein [unclassified Streptomyces]|uniref:DUF5667 domain-containing protein n=1 Tax=unclassified Streptomyces TaxID=2593676 RepID=UPI000DB91DFE|nr:DUF5667 domain-containing protein [Streptomyces sp. PsTaAH-137]MYT70350.1 hypothetical protein [Streptomyces sp. SID8367]RAJ70684.1 hypothetical protein K377_07847 [Streptomyces sp. PsTaAH-137]